MSKTEIINHLESLLLLLSNTPSQMAANEKRRRDLRFLNNYRIERQREIFGYIMERVR